VVIGDLYVIGIAGNVQGVRLGRYRGVGNPCEANPVLVVDPDAVLSGPVAPQSFEPVSSW
jgi:hypothetical protein